MSTSFPLKENDEVREATVSCGSLHNRLSSSSEMPSLKYSLSGSLLRLRKGKTATESKPSFGGSAMSSSFAGGGSAGSATIPGSGRMPSGFSSKAQANTSATGKPITSRAITRRTLQSGSSSSGNITEAISTTTQETTAYTAPTRSTLRRLSSP